MADKLTKLGYQRLIQENLNWLSKQPNTLECRHIAEVLAASVDHEYPPQVNAEIKGWDNDWIDIRWSWEGEGFGQLLIQKTKEGVIVDSETLPKEMVARIMAAVAETLQIKDYSKRHLDVDDEEEDDHP